MRGVDSDWTTKLWKELASLRCNLAGWPYQPNGTPSIEPSCLAALAAIGLHLPKEIFSDSVRTELSNWVMSLQQSDGLIPVSANLLDRGWPTSHAILFWLSLPDRSKVEPSLARAIDWLLKSEGKTYRRDADDISGHDPSIPGWAWVAETHSWIEPTALAVLALRMAGKQENARVKDGLRLLRDRALKTGGWNYGSKSVFGQDMRAQPAPTGISLFALAGVEPEKSSVANDAAKYLESVLPKTRSPSALGWGLLALTAWKRRPKDADQWLQQAYAKLHRQTGRPLAMVQLLLGAVTGPQKFMGIDLPATEKTSTPKTGP